MGPNRNGGRAARTAGAWAWSERQGAGEGSLLKRPRSESAIDHLAEQGKQTPEEAAGVGAAVGAWAGAAAKAAAKARRRRTAAKAAGASREEARAAAREEEEEEEEEGRLSRSRRLRPSAS